MIKCLETRQREGVRYRRYRAEDGSTYATYEVPISVLRAIGMKRVRERIEIFNRGQRQRAQQRGRKVMIEHYLLDGWKPTAIANEVGVSEAYVRKVRQALIDEAKARAVK